MIFVYVRDILVDEHSFFRAVIFELFIVFEIVSGIDATLSQLAFEFKHKKGKWLAAAHARNRNILHQLVDSQHFLFLIRKRC
jgi:hypothetical protein